VHEAGELATEGSELRIGEARLLYGHNRYPRWVTE
jgi:hypothetical protein